MFASDLGIYTRAEHQRGRCTPQIVTRGGAEKRLRLSFKAFVYTNAGGYGLESSEPVGSPASVTVANGVYSLGLKTYTSEFPSSP